MKEQYRECPAIAIAFLWVLVLLGTVTSAAAQALIPSSQRLNGSLGVNVAPPAGLGLIAQTLGANNVTGHVIKRFTNTLPTGNFVDYQTAAGVSRYSVSVDGIVSARGEVLQPGTDGTVLDIKNAAGTSRWGFDTTTTPAKAKFTTRLFGDSTGGYFDFGYNSHQIYYENLAVSQPLHMGLYIQASARGDSTNYYGVTGLTAAAFDHSTVDAAHKPSLSAIRAWVASPIDHNIGGIDDANAINVENRGTGKLTEALYFGRNLLIPGSAWYTLITFNSHADNGLLFAADFVEYGLDFHGVAAAPPTYGAGMMRFKNNSPVVARNAANSADIPLLKLDSNNHAVLRNITFPDGTTDFSASGGTSQVVKQASAGGAFTVAQLASTELSDTANLLRVLSKTRPNETINNSATNVDFTSVYTIPANTLTTGTFLRVELDFTYTMSGSPTTSQVYLKLGGTLVYTMVSGATLTASTTRHLTVVVNIFGTATPGAAVNVEVSPLGVFVTQPVHNATATQALATNGTLTIVPGITWGATGSADAMTLRNATVTQVH